MYTVSWKEKGFRIVTLSLVPSLWHTAPFLSCAVNSFMAEATTPEIGGSASGSKEGRYSARSAAVLCQPFLVQRFVLRLSTRHRARQNQDNHRRENATVAKIL